MSKSKDLYSNFISTKNKLNTDNFKSRLTYNTDFGFYIDTDNMKMIESDNFITLTAQIYRIGKLDKKENLYIHQNNDGSYYAYIFDYTFNEEDINKYVLNQPIDDIIVKTKFKPLDYTVNATSNTTSGYNGTVIPYNGYCYTINHVYEGEDGEPWVTLVLCPNCECNSTPNTETLTQDGGGGGGLINIIYIPGSGVNPIEGGGVPTSGSNNSTGNSNSNPVLTQPVISQNMTEIKILSLLNEEQTNWWWFTATKVIKDEIIAFFNSSGFDENIDFSKQMIYSMINNEGYSGDGFLGDNDIENNVYNGPKELIPSTIILNDGSTVSVTFGITSSDNQTANNLVAVDLVNSITFALNEANSNLSSSEKITSIYIMATTNGTHSATSNHSRGTAVDVSRINDVKIINLGANSQVKALQNAFDDYQNIRENFGPYFKHKTFPNGTVNLNWPIGGHQDHIHVSVQSN